MVREHLSWPCVWIVTSFPWANSNAACLARLPFACPFSGQSMPFRRMRSARLLWRTSMV